MLAHRWGDQTPGWLADRPTMSQSWCWPVGGQQGPRWSQGQCWPVDRWARSHHSRLQGCGGPEAGIHPPVPQPSGLEGVRFCVHPVRVESLPQSSGTPKSKPCWPSEPNVLWARLTGAGPQGWGAQCGAQTHSSLLRASAVVLTFQVVGPHSEVRVLAVPLHPACPSGHVAPPWYLGPGPAQQWSLCK